MPPERHPKEALLAKANGRRPVRRPRTRWTNYIEDLGWSSLGLFPREMMDVMEDREVWRLNLELLPRNSHVKAGKYEERRRSLKAERCFLRNANLILKLWNSKKIKTNTLAIIFQPL